MQLDIGYFEEFKGRDTLLIAGEPAEIRSLARALESFAASEQQSFVLPLRGYRVGGAQLRLTKDPLGGDSQESWLVTSSEVSRVVEQLHAVAHGAPAHQYFELVGSGTQLMVAAGEYPSEWWQAQA